MVQVAIGGRGQLQRAETDVVQSLVVDAERLVRVLDQLMDRQRRVVRLHHRVRHLT